MGDTDNNNRKKRLGELIRRFREAEGISQLTLAERIAKVADAGATVARTDVQISRIETGQSGTTPETLDAIVAVLYTLTPEQKSLLYQVSRFTQPLSEDDPRLRQSVEEPMTRQEAERLLSHFRTAPRAAWAAAEVAVDAILSQFPTVAIKDTLLLPDAFVESREEPLEIQIAENLSENISENIDLPLGLPGLLLNAWTGELQGPQGVLSPAKTKAVSEIVAQILGEWMHEERDEKTIRELLAALREKMEMGRDMPQTISKSYQREFNEREFNEQSTLKTE